MKKQVIFKKGQIVNIKHGANASYFNDGLSAYVIKDWWLKEFEIEGTVKLITFEHNPEVYGAYLLKYNGKNIGYVYNTGITLVENQTK